MPTIRLLWVEPPHALQGWDIEAPQRIVDEGRFEVNPGEFHGPAGTYRLLGPDECFAMHPEGPVPLFLHESYETVLEKWSNFLTDTADEIAIVARVRDAVERLADSRLAGNPAAFTPKPTVTTTEPTNDGIAVVGRTVVFRPSQA